MAFGEGVAGGIVDGDGAGAHGGEGVGGGVDEPDGYFVGAGGELGEGDVEAVVGGAEGAGEVGAGDGCGDELWGVCVDLVEELDGGGGGIGVVGPAGEGGGIQDVDPAGGGLVGVEFFGGDEFWGRGGGIEGVDVDLVQAGSECGHGEVKTMICGAQRSDEVRPREVRRDAASGFRRRYQYARTRRMQECRCRQPSRGLKMGTAGRSHPWEEHWPEKG